VHAFLYVSTKYAIVWIEHGNMLYVLF